MTFKLQAPRCIWRIYDGGTHKRIRVQSWHVYLPSMWTLGYTPTFQSRPDGKSCSECLGSDLSGCSDDAAASGRVLNTCRIQTVRTCRRPLAQCRHTLRSLIAAGTREYRPCASMFFKILGSWALYASSLRGISTAFHTFNTLAPLLFVNHARSTGCMGTLIPHRPPKRRRCETYRFCQFVHWDCVWSERR